MPVFLLGDDLSDPRLEPYRNLKETNQTRREGVFIAEGEKLVLRLLDSPHELVSVLVSASHVERIAPQVPVEVPVLVVSPAAVEELVGFNFHRGVLACGRRTPGPTIAELLTAHAGRLTLVVCPDIKDPENLGAIFRISRAFGVDAAVLGPHCCDPYSRRVLRVSMGTVLRLPIVQPPDLAEGLEQLRGAGVQLAATVLDPAAEHLEGAGRPERFGLLFGCEGYGLERRWLELCDRQLTIAMEGGTDSLNVAVATGIFLYHFTRPGVHPESLGFRGGR
jgi:tRNA G18 (ribose-2'-O)-methylase SpoU